MGANHTKEQISSSQEIHHHDPMGSQLFLNSNILNTGNLNNQIMYPYNENDLNDNLNKSIEQQMKIASIGVNKSIKNKFKTNSNQNINSLVDPNGKLSFKIIILFSNSILF